MTLRPDRLDFCGDVGWEKETFGQSLSRLGASRNGRTRRTATRGTMGRIDRFFAGRGYQKKHVIRRGELRQVVNCADSGTDDVRSPFEPGSPLYGEHMGGGLLREMKAKSSLAHTRS